jgi:hypothetical protein
LSCSQQLGDSQHRAFVCSTGEVTEDVVESHSSPEHHPGGDSRIVTTGDEGYRGTLHPGRQATGPRDPVAEEVSRLITHLDPDGNIRVIEVDLGVAIESSAQLVVDVAGRERVSPGPPSPHSERTAPHTLAVEALPYLDDRVEASLRRALDLRE